MTPSTVQDIIRVLNSNAGKAKAPGRAPRPGLPAPSTSRVPIGSDRALDTALITAPEARDPQLLKKLDAVAGRVLRSMKVDGRHFRSIWLERTTAGRWARSTSGALPHEFVIARTDECRRRGADAIRSMLVRGAPLIGATAAYGMALALRDDRFRRRARPRLRAADRDAADRDQSEMGARRDEARRFEPLRAVRARGRCAYARAAEIAEEDVAINRGDRPAWPGADRGRSRRRSRANRSTC